MRIAVVSGRTKIIDGQSAVDIANASSGQFGPHPRTVYDNWSEFREWASVADLPTGEPFVAQTADAPSPEPRQVFAIGLNYLAHQVEAGFPRPTEPMVFTKFASSICGPVGDLTLFTDDGLGSRNGHRHRHQGVPGARTRRLVLRSGCDRRAGLLRPQCADETGRHAAVQPLGKFFPGFTPMGPVLVTPDEIDNCDDIAVRCVVNGQVVQDSSTADLIFPVEELIAYLSTVLPLLPGDVILTGTPSGVGLGVTPPVYLRPGDHIVTAVADQSLQYTAIARTNHLNKEHQP